MKLFKSRPKEEMSTTRQTTRIMTIRNSLLLVYAAVPLLFCNIAQKTAAQGVSEDFNSYANGTQLSNVTGWLAPADFVVRQITQIDQFSTNTGSLGYPGVVYGSCGYNGTQGLETDFQTSVSGSGTETRGALWTLTGGQAINQNGAVIQAQIRLSSYGIGGTGNTNTVSDANNGFVLLFGSGFTYFTNGTNPEFNDTNATAFGVLFYDNGTETPAGYRIYFERVGYSSAANNGVPGFQVGGLTNWTGYSNNWMRDMWYTVQFSNIVFSTSPTNEFATATLNVFESANPSVLVVSNINVRSQAGLGATGGLITTGPLSNNWCTAGPFTAINQVALAEGRLNGVDTIDNISLVESNWLEITSIAQQSTNINVTWQTFSGDTDAVQAASNVGGPYSNISGPITVPEQGASIQVTNYVVAGAVSNQPAQFYRIQSSGPP